MSITTDRHLADTHYCPTCTYRHGGDDILCPHRNEEDPQWTAERTARGVTYVSQAARDAKVCGPEHHDVRGH